MGPPSGPPSGPPAGAPWGPPSGPEFLQSGGGGPVPPSAPRSRRKAIIAGGGIVGVAALGAGAFALYSVFLATGPQPAEALPASTVGYLSIDLDPSGQQKLEALDALEKFPVFNENVDIKSDEDLRQKLFEMAQDGEVCADVDFDDDIEPWLGNRFGVAAVELGEENDEGVAEPTPVGVIQVDDADRAEEGLKLLRDCGSQPDADIEPPGDEFGSDDPAEEDTAPAETFGWSIQGDWVVIAETDDLAKQVTDAAADDPLSSDDDYQKWTDAAGDAGILSAYAAPEAGSYFADAVDPLSGLSTTCSGTEVEPYGSDEYGTDEYGCVEEESEPSAETEQLKKIFEDFSGAAMTVRFDDGGLEIESASSVDFLGLDKIYGSDQGAEALSTLPADTAVAVGVGFEDGWIDEIRAYADSLGAGAEFDEGLAMLEDETGLTADDIETLTGDSAAFALGGDFDPNAVSEDDPSSLPLGVKVKGDTDAITEVIDKLLANENLPPEVKDLFGYETEGDYVVGGFSPEYTEQLLEDGGLGDTDLYRDVVKESDDAAAVLFVSFNAGDWLEKAASGNTEVAENLEPLGALGMSAWTDDDGTSHSVLRLTTD